MSWSGLEAPEGFLAEGRKAPLAIPRETAASYRRAIVTLLEGTGVPLNTVEAGLSTSSALLEGAQEVLAASNRLVEADASPKSLIVVARDLLLEIGAMLRQRNAAYAIHQMAGLLESRLEAPPAPAMPRIARLKDYLTPLETAFERVGVTRTLEPERLGPLLVHLDELYDDAAQQLQRLFQVAAKELSEARGLAPEFLRRLYTDFAHATFVDHVLGEEDAAKEPGSGTGLLQLLPQLVESLESV
jgi:hypothetical protein